MRPLRPKRETQNDARKWHRDVFALRGDLCFFCGARATDAMHIQRRGMHLGPLRYCDPRIGLAGCRRCHELEDVGKLQFPLHVRVAAALALNEYAKVKFPIPTE